MDLLKAFDRYKASKSIRHITGELTPSHLAKNSDYVYKICDTALKSEQFLPFFYKRKITSKKVCITQIPKIKILNNSLKMLECHSEHQKRAQYSPSLNKLIKYETDDDFNRNKMHLKSGVRGSYVEWSNQFTLSNSTCPVVLRAIYNQCITQNREHPIKIIINQYGIDSERLNEYLSNNEVFSIINTSPAILEDFQSKYGDLIQIEQFVYNSQIHTLVSVSKHHNKVSHVLLKKLQELCFENRCMDLSHSFKH